MKFGPFVYRLGHMVSSRKRGSIPRDRHNEIFCIFIVIKKNSKIFSYVGMSKDLKKRINLHNSSKGAKYTKGKKWILAYKKSTIKSKALKEEYSLKKDKKREKIKKTLF